jgi:hypothetical protein
MKLFPLSSERGINDQKNSRESQPKSATLAAFAISQRWILRILKQDSFHALATPVKVQLSHPNHQKGAACEGQSLHI